MMLRNVLAFTTVLIAVACGGTSSLGKGGGNVDSGGSGGEGGNGGSGGTAGNAGNGGGPGACEGKPCGALCTDCRPGEACLAIAMYCDGGGNCGQAFPVCEPPGQCDSDADCPAIGAPCEMCPDGSYACPSVVCVNGQCAGSFEGCQGASCNDDGDCPVSDAPCQQCPDGSIACTESKCVNGECAWGSPGCGGYDPCLGKACGETCTQCPPGDPACAEDSVLKYCDARGTCSPNVPRCDGWGGSCRTKTDCPGVGACPACPGGACAELDCVNGACQFNCPPHPEPRCSTSRDCIAPDICLPCDRGGCATSECLNGQCVMVCGV